MWRWRNWSGRQELPGYTTLDEAAATIRAEVNAGLFAGIAGRMSGPDATDAADLRKYGTAKRQALIACLLDAFGDVLAVVREALEPPVRAQDHEVDGLAEVPGEPIADQAGAADGEGVSEESVHARAGRVVLATLERAGGVGALSEAHEVVAAHHGDNYLPFAERFYRGSRSALFDILDVLTFQAATADHRVLVAVEFLRANRARSGEHLSLAGGEKDGRPAELDVSFVAENWRKIDFDPRRPGRVVRAISRCARSATSPASCTAAISRWSVRSPTRTSWSSCCRRRNASR